MTGPGDATTATARWSATLNDMRQSLSCRIGSQLRLRPGWRSNRRSASSPGDRGGGYAVAAQRALPHAIQVADRWHLMENASGAFLDAVRSPCARSGRPWSFGDRPVASDLCRETAVRGVCTPRRDQRRHSLIEASKGLRSRRSCGAPGTSRGLIRKILRGQRSDVFRVRQSSLDPYLPWLDEQWEAGCRNGAALWRALRLRGFRGCLRVVSEWSARRKKAEKA